jgi:hypothetical protein
MPSEVPDIAAQEARVRELVATVHRNIVERNDGGAVDALISAAEAALDVLIARVESDEPPNRLSADDNAAWALVTRASIEFEHGNQLLGDWYRESARRRALERYDPSIKPI